VVHQPTLEDQRQIAATLRRPGERMTRREAIAEAVLVTGFVAALAALWVAAPPGDVDVVPTLLCVGVLAYATRVRFDTPFGFTAPTQLAFIPLLFTVPLPLVPIAAVVALATAPLIELARGRLQPARVVLAAGNGWWAIGPVSVFVISGTQPLRAGPVLLLAALAAQFAIDFLISGLRFRYTEGASFASQLREAWVWGVDAALSGVGLVVARQMPGSPADVLALVPLLALFTMFSRERRQRLEAVLELGNAYRGTALVLGDVVEADDGYTGQHCKSVVGLALDVADRLELTDEQRRNLEFGALLHDVGKIAIPKEIINKPGTLTPEEWTVIKTHTLEGQRMLERVGGFMRDVGLIVRSHHERWDGGGYPDGLRGEAIPLEARIVACCDTWNAMRTDRTYRKALPYETAMAELRRASGTQLDPTIVETLVELVAAEEQAATVDLGGETAARLPALRPAAAAG
jgi:putative nucleotidyltransferase with HDIG domain